MVLVVVVFVYVVVKLPEAIEIQLASAWLVACVDPRPDDCGGAGSVYVENRGLWCRFWSL